MSAGCTVSRLLPWCTCLNIAHFDHCYPGNWWFDPGNWAQQKNRKHLQMFRVPKTFENVCKCFGPGSKNVINFLTLPGSIITVPLMPKRLSTRCGERHIELRRLVFSVSVRGHMANDSDDAKAVLPRSIHPTDCAGRAYNCTAVCRRPRYAPG